MCAGAYGAPEREIEYYSYTVIKETNMFQPISRNKEKSRLHASVQETSHYYCWSVQDFTNNKT